MSKTGQCNKCPVGDRDGLLAFNSSEQTLFSRLLGAREYEKYRPHVLNRDPWILQFDNLLTATECKEVLGAASNSSFVADVVGLAGRVKSNSNYRNSSSFSCPHDAGCMSQSGFSVLTNRVRELKLDLKHSEGFSVLKYEVGGFYKRHHDYAPRSLNPSQWDNCGPRVLTFMAYLSDVHGGETNFFNLGIKVAPKAGRALLWADVFAHNPLVKDERTAHEALTVTKGTKYVFNMWFNQFDKEANDRQQCCTW
eukprot:TRINITY_DN17982_c0_g1_i1.p1 TRINITY_DN17982_c0_g1~~TRINITY_DN17982_c0_g1_i1.p1  ORF type:complete len:252 (-),score=36.45 TRINITY_DN17982_c0_g1_i1:293-1048(-)